MVHGAVEEIHETIRQALMAHHRRTRRIEVLIVAMLIINSAALVTVLFESSRPAPRSFYGTIYDCSSVRSAGRFARTDLRSEVTGVAGGHSMTEDINVAVNRLESRVDEVGDALTSLSDGIGNVITLVQRLIEAATRPRPKDNNSELLEQILSLLELLVGETGVAPSNASTPKKSREAKPKQVAVQLEDGDPLSGSVDAAYRKHQ